jgi:hypothetical protein
MPIVLTDVKQKTGPNPGGVVNLYLCIEEDVDTLPDAVAGVISTDLVVSGTGFKKFEFSPGKCSLTHPTVGEDGSKSFETMIECTVDGDDAERMALFESMINGKFIAIVDMASDKMRVAGSKRVPLLCIQANYGSGADQPEQNGTVFQFKGRGGKYSPVYEGVVPVVIP